MSDKTESHQLYLNSFTGSPYLVNKPNVTTSYPTGNPNYCVFTINWDAIFNLNNHKYNKCRLRYDFYSNPTFLSNPFFPTFANGALVLNGINARSTSTTGGMVLGLITLDSIAVTSSNATHQSLISNNFIASIPVGVGTTPSVMTINNTSSPLFMLAVSDYVTWYNATAFTTNGYTTPVGYVTKQVASVTGAYTYTLLNLDGSNFVNSTTTALVNVPFTCTNALTQNFVCLKSTNLQGAAGQSIEVPRGMKNLEVLLAENSYGQVTSGVVQPLLLQGSNMQDWGLILNFELYDPKDGNDYTY